MSYLFVHEVAQRASRDDEIQTLLSATLEIAAQRLELQPSNKCRKNQSNSAYLANAGVGVLRAAQQMIQQLIPPIVGHLVGDRRSRGRGDIWW